jgi:hypothetical protein
MQAVFDAPAATSMGRQARCVGALARKAADGVLDFDRGASPGGRFVVVGGLALWAFGYFLVHDDCS